ncbi:MAG: lactate utilization protein [Proteobacteria bacterium]|nr:lactate utilization protein [Pseudomonadota bacterium]
MSARDDILGTVRRSLKRGGLTAEQEAPLLARLARPQAGPIPARSAGRDRRGLVELFDSQACEVHATVARVASLADVPAAIGDYLARQNLPAEMTAAPDKLLDGIPWDRRPLLRLKRGKPDPADAVGLSAAFAGIAETGTLMLISGAHSPSTLNFLPDTHVVVLPAARLVGPLEEAWKRLRAATGAMKLAGAAMPRTVNFITGPSRSADIELTLQLGAHGPRRLHIVVVEDDAVA